MALIALMTDFGTRDYYVASMKGIILQINPKADIIDITHEIESHDIYHGAFVLRQVVPCFPARTIFVAVVDPTVGTSRSILVARYEDRLILAPDNGLLTLLHRDFNLQEIRLIQNRQYFGNSLSTTFHGRDVFAPVAAHLSRGLNLQHLGPLANHLEILDLPRAHINPDGSIDGLVLLVDRFGNLITNISARDLSKARCRPGNAAISIGPHALGPIRNTYAEVAPGQPVAVIGSSQMLEIAVNRGNAAQLLDIPRGAAVHVR